MELKRKVHSYSEAVKIVEEFMEKFVVKFFMLESFDDGIHITIEYVDKTDKG